MAQGVVGLPVVPRLVWLLAAPDQRAGIVTLRVLSLGGGTQSCALALMSAGGDLPKLDHIIFADTQGELPETYAYLDYLRSVVEPAGIPLHIVTAGSLESGLLRGCSSVNPTPPAHLMGEDGRKGRVNGYKCSYDFKRRQIESQIKRLCGGRGAWKSAQVEQWIGFSLDETGRMKTADGCRCGHAAKAHEQRRCSRCGCEAFSVWLTNKWPLIDLRMRRDDTIRWFKANGHPTPPRSACWFCPNSGNARWQQLRADHPDLFERACVIDETIRNVTDFKYRNRTDRGMVGGPLYLHGSCVPLRDADLRTEAQVLADAGHLSLFDEVALGLDCEAGVCFT